MRTRMVKVGQVELELWEAEPTVPEVGKLLLVHGFTGAGEDFVDWLDVFAADGWHVVAPTQRGHGNASKPTEASEYSLDQYADDLMELLEVLGWDQFVLLGHSMGGMIAQLVAARVGDRLDGLVLMDTGHGPLRMPDQVLELAAQVAVSGGMQAVLDGQRAMAADAPLASAAHERVLRERPGYAEFGDRKLLSASPVMYASMLRGMSLQADRLEKLHAIKVPTLVLVGDQDRPFIKPMKRVAEAIDGAEYVELPNAGHSPQFENPEAWGAAMRSFLTRITA